MPAKARLVHAVFHPKAAYPRPGHPYRRAGSVPFPVGATGEKLRHHGYDGWIHHPLFRLCPGDPGADGGGDPGEGWLPIEEKALRATQKGRSHAGRSFLSGNSQKILTQDIFCGILGVPN